MIRKGSFPLWYTIRRPGFLLALLLAVGLAVFWYLVADRVGANTGAPIWSDQYNTFTQVVNHLQNPYQLVWPYVPWAALLVAPFGLFELSIAVLGQLLLYYVLLTGVIYRFGGSIGTVLLVFTSAFAYDTALEINLEWIVVLGLLLPPVLSGPLLLVKPQAALGAWFGFRWQQILWGGLLTILVMALAFVIWPNYLNDMREAIRINTLGDWGNRVNIAISQMIPVPISWAIGLSMAWVAFRRHDVILGVLAWQFLVPYATFYGMMPAFALLAARWPWAALIISVATWIPYSQVLFPFL